MELDQNKIYFKIGEAAEYIGEPVSLVRFWSDTYSEFIKPVRNAKGNRLFSHQDMKVLRTVHYLVKEKGMTLEGARKSLKAKSSEISDKVVIIDKLKAIKATLEEIRGEL